MIVILYTISVYGMAWLFTKSSFFRPFRDYLIYSEQNEIKRHLSNLFNCIVCTSFWCGLIVAEMVRQSFSLSGVNIASYLILGLYSIGSTWIIASLIGDAS
jgi:hypothetical protein